MVDHHVAEFKTLMTWQVLMQEKMDKWAITHQAEQVRLNELSARTDERLSYLVTAIGNLLAVKR